MEYIYGTEEDKLVIFVFLVLAFFIILAFYFNVIAPFMKERDCIKMEMQHSYSEEEYRFWKRELRRVYLRHIPIIGRFFDN